MAFMAIQPTIFANSRFGRSSEDAISRIGGGQISVSKDLAEDLALFRDCILKKYRLAEGLAIMRLFSEFVSILERRSRGGQDYEEEFWTNESFQQHPDWRLIRRKSREFLLR